MRYTAEGWPGYKEMKETQLSLFHKISNSLSIAEGCLLYGNRVVIPVKLQPEVLKILHLGHFGMERMKKLARTAVYWPRIDYDIEGTSQKFTACAEHQKLPQKYPIHPWVLPEKPWSRLHLDHAVNFMGSQWLVMIDRNYFYIYKSYHRHFRGDICTLWIPSHHSYWQCYQLHLRRISAVVSSERHCSPYWSTLPYSYKWRSWTTSTIIQTSHEEIITLY